VKTANVSIFLGVIAATLISDSGSLRAQPASDSISIDGDPLPIVNDLSPADNESIVIDNPNNVWNRRVSTRDRDAARKLFLEGVRFVRVPLFAKAAEQFTLALRKWKHPAIYYNLALTQLYLSQEVEARENLKHALEHGEKPLGSPRFRAAQKQLRELEHQLGRIYVICQTPGVEITLDGIPLFTAPGTYQGWVKAKDYELTAKRDGYLSEARRVSISPGEIRKVDLKLITLEEAANASRRWAVWKPWAIVAGGGAIVAIGGVLHVLASGNFDAYDRSFIRLPCAIPSSQPPTTGCRGDQIPANTNDQLIFARGQQTVAIGAYIAGSSLAAAGLVLLYLNRSRLGEQKVNHINYRKVSVVPSMSADTVGVSLRMSH